MALSKLQKMQRFIPSIYKPTVNPNIRGLLYAWSAEDDAIVQAIQNAKEQIFVATSQLAFLDDLGSNVGVFRPKAINLSDALYRRLIPALSYWPKQMLPTIKEVLAIFFGDGNPRVSVHEIRFNTINIQIPSAVPALRRDLRGAIHFHAYSGNIASVDNVAKTITVDFDLGAVESDELVDAIIGSKGLFDFIQSNTAGSTGVELSFPASSDLSGFVPSDRFNMALPKYHNSFFASPDKAYTVTAEKGVLGQALIAGQVVSNLTMTDASKIPDASGSLIFNMGKPTEEALISYYGRPNNSTLLIDPGYVFQNAHSPGELINKIVTPYQRPDKSGTDYSIYVVGVTAARLLAQQIIESIVAAGVVIDWTIIGPQIKC